MKKVEQRVRNDSRVAEVSDERSDGHGVWAYTSKGYCNHMHGAPGLHSDEVCQHAIHEDSWSAASRALSELGPCDCARCKS